MKERLEFYTAAGKLDLIGPGLFIEKCVGRTVQAPIQVSSDDSTLIEGVEVGSFREDFLNFRRKVLKMKEIFDTQLLTEAVEHRQYREAAITHFGIQELQKFGKGLKTSLNVEGDLTVDHIQDLAYEFVQEMGSNGKLVMLKNSVIICNGLDFQIFLSEIYKTHKKCRMMSGALFCSRPARVIKATYTGRLKLV